MSNYDYRLQYRRNLPHIQPPGATFFVTFRLAGSIPVAVLRELRDKAEQQAETIESIEDGDERDRQRDRAYKQQFGRWDAYLDGMANGPYWLDRPEIARIVMESLHYRHGNEYDLDTFSVMPNHVHALFAPLQGEDGMYIPLQQIMHSLKRYTARQANKILGRQGQFWHHESYDHAVRDDAELGRIRRYILLNPLNAGLVKSWEEWPWSYCAYEGALNLEG